MTRDPRASGREENRESDDARVRLTTREFVGGSTAAAGGLAGCIGRDPSDVAGTPSARADQRAGPWTDDVDAGGHGLTNLGRLNDVIHVGEDEPLSAALDRADGSAYLVLPAGVSELDEPIADFGADLTIEGRGPERSILRSTGAASLWAQEEDAPDVRLALRGFTLDMDHRPSDRLVYADDASIHRLHVDDVEIRNMNLVEQWGYRAVFEFSGGAMDLVRIENTEVRFDTIENRSGHRYHVFNGQGKPDNDWNRVEIGRFIARSNRHVGDRITLDQRPELELYIGYRADITGHAIVRDCTFLRWDQYATFLQGGADATIKIVNNHLDEVGDADMIRTGSYEDGARVLVHGNTVRRGYGDGDRGIIVQDTGETTPRSVTVTNNVVEDTLQPIEITHGRNVTVANNNVIDGGHTDPEGSRMGIFVRNRRGDTEHVRIAGNTLTNENPDRRMGPAIRLQAQTGGPAGEWSGITIVENNLIAGDQTDPDRFGSDDPISIDDSIYEDTRVVVRHNEILDESGA